MSGLKHPSIDRLTKTFQGIRSSLREQMKSLAIITSKDSSYQNYKSKQEVTSAPCIPFVEPYLEEIAYIDTFNQDIGKGGIINFSKHRKLARMMRHLEQFKSTPYSDLGEPKVNLFFKKNPLFLNKLKKKPFIRDILILSLLDDDDTLQKKSFKCEPPNAVY